MLKKNILTSLLLMAIAPYGLASDFQGPVIEKNKAFVYEKDPAKRFVIRGVTWQSLDRHDDLADTGNTDGMNNLVYIKERVLPLLKKLNVNAIRVYQIDPRKDHTQIMNLLRDNGIYVLVGMVTNAPENGVEPALNRLDPHYNQVIRNRLESVVKAFGKYENTLGFEVGNEVVFPGNILGTVMGGGNLASARPEDKAKAREIEQYAIMSEKQMIEDTKLFLKKYHLRPIPVGTSLQDTNHAESIGFGMIGTDMAAKYYACGSAGERADFIGFNTYRYLPGGNINAYDFYAQVLEDSPVPVVFTEAGAQYGEEAMKTGRDWKIVSHLFDNNSAHLDNFSGHFAFRLFQRKEAGNSGEDFGLYYDNLSPEVKKGTALAFTPTPFGGADHLEKVYGDLAKIENEYRPVESRKMKDKECNTLDPQYPGLEVIPADREVTLYNYSNVPMLVMQENPRLGWREYGWIEAGKKMHGRMEPVTRTLSLDKDYPLKMLSGDGKYYQVCTLSKLSGNIVHNKVHWGGKCGEEKPL